MGTDQPRRDSGPPQEGATRVVSVRLGDVKDVPVLHANHITVNFTGFEFYLTVASAVPPPWVGGEQPPSEIEARVLGRFVFSPAAWQEAVRSVSEQMERLNAARALPTYPADVAPEVQR